MRYTPVHFSSKANEPGGREGAAGGVCISSLTCIQLGVCTTVVCVFGISLPVYLLLILHIRSFRFPPQRGIPVLHAAAVVYHTGNPSLFTPGWSAAFRSLDEAVVQTGRRGHCYIFPSFFKKGAGERGQAGGGSSPARGRLRKCGSFLILCRYSICSPSVFVFCLNRAPGYLVCTRLLSYIILGIPVFLRLGEARLSQA